VTADAALDPKVVELLREAAAWRLIGLLFECPRLGWHAQVATLAKEIDDRTLHAAADAAQDQAAEGLYHTVFGPGGPAAPREISYRRVLQPGQFLSELETYYGAFAYAPDSLEPPDHVSVQAGFVAYLVLKQAYAASSGQTEQAALTADAVKQFLQEHLAWLAAPLAAALAASGIDYLEAAGQALADRVGPAPLAVQEPP
jgi:nitrate reductase assembly molybdenum cofactor insertion protein NarJ